MNRSPIATLCGMLTILLLCACAPAQRPQADVTAEPAPTPTAAPTGSAQPESLIRVHAFISGKVQGVGFRAFARDTVVWDNLRVTGWVKNLADGRVELIAEGPRTDIEKLMAAVAKGPAGSRVDALARQEEPYTGAFTEFVIATE